MCFDPCGSCSGRKAHYKLLLYWLKNLLVGKKPGVQKLMRQWFLTLNTDQWANYLTAELCVCVCMYVCSFTVIIGGTVYCMSVLL